MFDDSDMKIVGAVGKAPAQATETADFLAESGRQHFNGNFAKAKALGANIVSAFSYQAAPEELDAMVRERGLQPEGVLLQQMKFLSVFSAEYCLNRYLPSPMLASVAVGEMYDVLQQVSPALYDALSHAAAFSFYYMSVKNAAAGGIGAQFAELCDMPDDPRVADLGDALHKLNCSVYKRAIRGFVFV
ncbi:MAG: hypothetical protein IJT27_03455 [Clostridia bacterium]|nr:hypothetical protein [Clostridia bacterium]